MQEKIESILKGLALGETLGSLFEGMSRGHVESHFKQIKGYPDTFDALKGHYDNWTKPGLYGATTQFAVISALIASERPLSYDSVRAFVSMKGRVLDAAGGVFRHSSRALLNFLVSCYKNSPIDRFSSGESAAFLPIAASGILPMFHYACPPADEIFVYAASFGSDTHSIVGAALFASILYRGIHSDDDDAVSAAIEESLALVAFCKENQPALFTAGFNPDRMSESALFYHGIFSALRSSRDVKSAEKIIVEKINGIMKSPVIRATIDHPCAVLPFACVLASTGSATDRIYLAAANGGASGSLAAMTGMLAGGFAGDIFPDELSADLVNRKSLFDAITLAASGEGGTADADRFFESEVPLTAKEIAEKGSKLRHVRTPEKKQEAPKSREEMLSRHIVESWTKLDRARWKKEKKQQDGEIEG